jgi:hypothetical protein
MTTTTDLPASNPVRHIVAWRFVDGTTSQQIVQFTVAFRALQHAIPGIIAFEHGANISPENLHRGLTHIYTLTFENVAARDVYLPHPEHQRFGEIIRAMGIVAEVLVLDYTPSV